MIARLSLLAILPQGGLPLDLAADISAGLEEAYEIIKVSASPLTAEIVSVQVDARFPDLATAGTAFGAALQGFHASHDSVKITVRGLHPARSKS
jgi:hypothetical protein